MKALLIAMVFMVGCSEQKTEKVIKLKRSPCVNDPRISPVNVGGSIDIRIVSVEAHDYLITDNYRGLSVIHLESCSCKSGGKK